MKGKKYAGKKQKIVEKARENKNGEKTIEKMRSRKVYLENSC